MLYYFYETQKRMLSPLSMMLNHTSKIMDHWEHFAITPIPTYVKAFAEVSHQFTKEYPKPHFNIKTVLAEDNQTYSIQEEVITEKSFCNLLHFKKLDSSLTQTPLLIVAPLSGHYATLLRDTVKSSLKDFDVYITDWKNAANVPVEEGVFGFEDYMSYCEEFIVDLKKKHGEINLLAVCQPTVPVLAVVAYLEKNSPENCPKSLVLMGGPIDTRESPTAVNDYAMKNNINWFKSHVIDVVPHYKKGAGRKVYPGYLQHAGFLSMNLKKHNQANIDFFNHMIKGADLDAKKHKDFYNEYNAVLDLDEKFYIETLENIFFDQKLVKGTLSYKGVLLNLEDIKQTNILGFEGELDDISGLGQTNCVIKLTKNLDESKKIANVIEGVGHYGLFSGRKWREQTYPKMKNFIKIGKFE